MTPQEYDAQFAALCREYPALSENRESLAAICNLVEKFNYDKGTHNGAQEERARCVQHIKFGMRFDAIDMALSCIQSGQSVDMTVMADYALSRHDRANSDARQADSDAASGAADRIGVGSSSPTASDQTAQRMAAALRGGVGR